MMIITIIMILIWYWDS